MLLQTVFVCRSESRTLCRRTVRLNRPTVCVCLTRVDVLNVKTECERSKNRSSSRYVPIARRREKIRAKQRIAYNDVNEFFVSFSRATFIRYVSRVRFSFDTRTLSDWLTDASPKYLRASVRICESMIIVRLKSEFFFFHITRRTNAIVVFKLNVS